MLSSNSQQLSEYQQPQSHQSNHLNLNKPKNQQNQQNRQQEASNQLIEQNVQHNQIHQQSRNCNFNNQQSISNRNHNSSNRNANSSNGNANSSNGNDNSSQLISFQIGNDNKNKDSVAPIKSISSLLSKNMSSLLPKGKNNNLKEAALQSFQKSLTSVTFFNEFIDKEFNKMTQQKAQNPTLIIPGGFKKFIHSKLFQNLIHRIYEYMVMLLDFQRKYAAFKKQESQKGIYQRRQSNASNNQLRYQTSVQKMKYQSYQLEQKCKQISYIYMGILLSHGQCKMIFKDQYFFETMIYFIAQILKSISHFEQEHYSTIQQELNRIFRTDAFNLIKRRNVEDQIYKKYPILKQGQTATGSSKYDSSSIGINRMIKRISIQKRKFNYSLQMNSKRRSSFENGSPNNDKISPGKIKKPVQIQLSSFGSTQSRSPLISSFYPSPKEKLYEFGRSTREKESFIKQINNNGSNKLLKTFYQKSLNSQNNTNLNHIARQSKSFFYRPGQFPSFRSTAKQSSPVRQKASQDFHQKKASNTFSASLMKGSLSMQFPSPQRNSFRYHKNRRDFAN